METGTDSESFLFYTILECSSGWSKFKDHCYKFDHKARPWKDTLEFCEKYQVKAPPISICKCAAQGKGKLHIKVKTAGFIRMKN